MSLKPETKARLMTVSTATLCTALFKRGLRNQFMQDVHPLNPSAGRMVGEAFTLRYIPAREDLSPMSVFEIASRLTGKPDCSGENPIVSLTFIACQTPCVQSDLIWTGKALSYWKFIKGRSA